MAEPCLLWPQVLTANTEANAGRRFFKCAHASEAEACLNFQWADEAGGGNENCRAAANAPSQGRFGGVTGVARRFRVSCCWFDVQQPTLNWGPQRWAIYKSSCFLASTSDEADIGRVNRAC